MSRQVKGAPYCFVMKHVEICIKWIIVNQLNLDVLLRVSEGAIDAIFAVLDLIRIIGTKLCLIFVWTIQLFNTIMRKFAIIPKVTYLFSFKGFTHFYIVNFGSPDPIFTIVIIRTLFVVMKFLFVTRIFLEKVKIKMYQVLNWLNCQESYCVV
jgi:hypothetical protein